MGVGGTEQDNKETRHVMSLFNSIAELQFPREMQEAAPLLSDAGAHRPGLGESKSGINHIQTDVYTFFLGKKNQEQRSPTVKESKMD